MVHTCNRCNKSFKKLWMLTCHLQNRKFLCRPQVISTTNQILIPQIDLEVGINTKYQISNSSFNKVSDSSGLSNKNTIDLDKYLSREEFEFLKTLDLIENDAILDTSIQFIQIRVSDPKRPYDNFNLLTNAKDEITRVLKIKLNKKEHIKLVLVALCYYKKVNKSLKKEDKENNIIYCHHRSKIYSLLSENDIDNHISQSASKIDKDIEEILR
ncbi:6598_t:CDS:2 [Scutellospora calospora]|uniref:6598_t:CDS:1 n=1 Tax=Scutellospora calospora TaxID=85575 RepID=A0ACA9NCP2_9GLOM|nr:6598_t:CDS:2 [Scutellospora calospora]